LYSDVLCTAFDDKFSKDGHLLLVHSEVPDKVPERVHLVNSREIVVRDDFMISHLAELSFKACLSVNP